MSLSGGEGEQPTSEGAVAGLAGIASILPGAHPISGLTMPGGRLPVKGHWEHLLIEPLLTAASLLGTGYQVCREE